MIWSQLVQNWSNWYSALQHKFPQLEWDSRMFLRQSRDNFVAYLADRHDLTLLEAEEALEDFLLLADLEDTDAPLSKVG